MTKQPKSMFGNGDEAGTEKAGNESELEHEGQGKEEVSERPMKSMDEEHPHMENTGEVLHPKLEMLMKSLEENEEDDKPTYKGGYVGMKK